VVAKKKIDPEKMAKALGAKRLTDPKEIEEFEKRYGLPSPFLPRVGRNKKVRIPRTCGNCKHWDFSGFTKIAGDRDGADVGRCQIVVNNWNFLRRGKMIAIYGTEHVSWPACELIRVMTQRRFGCNQFKLNGK